MCFHDRSCIISANHPRPANFRAGAGVLCFTLLSQAKGCGRPRGFFFRFPGDFFSGYGVYIAKHTRPEAATMRKGFAPLPFSNTERSQYSSLDCAVMPDMSSLGFSCGSVEVAIVWCGSTQDQFGILLLTP